MSDRAGIPAVYMRGGTSKAAMFHAADLPADPGERDRLLLALYGSPDPSGRQLDGIGGGTSSTSKAAVIGPGTRPDADVDYLFAQVGIERPEVDLKGNCGNISSAVGPFAIDTGLVPATGELTEVRIHNVNTGTVIVAHVPTRDGRFDPVGDYAIPGVPGTGSAIRLDFLDPAGAVTGALLPSGSVIDTLDVPGLGAVEASIVDAANPVVFVRAATLSDAQVADIRAAGAVRAGMIARVEDAHFTPAVPRVALVAPPAGDQTDTDVRVTMYSMGRLHANLPLTGAIATAVTARITGSVVHSVARAHDGAIRLRHPGGVQPVEAVAGLSGGAWQVERASTFRTARRLMSGLLEIPPPLVEGEQ